MGESPLLPLTYLSHTHVRRNPPIIILVGYGVDSNIFEEYEHRESPFERNRKKISSMFIKWRNRDKRMEYIQAFSTEKWKKLAWSTQERHTLQKCKECTIIHTALQNSFPGQKMGSQDNLSNKIGNIIQQEQNKHTATRAILSELQPIYEQTYGQSFIEALTELPDSQVQPKENAVDRRRRKRQVQRDCKQQMENQLKQTDAITVLAEGMSMQSYKRLRLSQCFESPVAKRARVENKPVSNRKHSPTFDNTVWDKQKTLEDLSIPIRPNNQLD